MILNNYEAMRRIRELRGHPVTIELLCEIHRIVTADTLSNSDAAGRFQRSDEERIVVGDDQGNTFHVPPPAKDLPERVQRLCDFANGELGDAYVPGVIRAIIAHFALGYEHPFEDGNGRTARALFYWVMLSQEYWLTEFISISRILKNAPSMYARSFLYTEQDEGDLTYFILYQLDVLQRSISDLHQYLQRKMQEIKDFQRSLATMPGEFNHRQLALLQHAARNPDARYTVQSHGRSHDVVRQTARQDLIDLENRGLLERFTYGRKFIWSPAADIVDRLENENQTRTLKNDASLW
jgi:Fic family protein